MSRKKAINPAIKKHIIKRVEEGEPVKELANKHQISPVTIYSWLQAQLPAGERKLLYENRSLKKENRDLYTLIGELVASIKKERPGKISKKKFLS